MIGHSVLLVRASVQCAEPGAHATNVYAFGVIGTDDDAEDNLVRLPVLVMLILSLPPSVPPSLLVF